MKQLVGIGKNQKTSYSDSFSIEQPQLSEDELVDDVPEMELDP